MEIFKIIGVGLITCISVIVVRQVKPEIAVILGLTGGIIIILMTINALTDIVSSFSTIIEKSGLSKGLFSTILTVVGIGYLVEFSANLCRDSGSSGLADKILLSGKILILALAMPVVTNILEIIMGLMPLRKYYIRFCWY